MHADPRHHLRTFSRERPRRHCRLASRSRRRYVLGLAGMLGLGATTRAHAFLPLLLRLLFGMTVRSGAVRGVAAGAVRAAASRAAAGQAARVVVRSGAAAGTRVAAQPAVASGATRLAAAMRPARRVAVGAASTTAAGSSFASVVDLALIAHDVHALLGDGVLPESTVVNEPIEALQVEMIGHNTSDRHVNGALSLLIFDEAFAAGGEGRFMRQVFGVATPAPGALLHFVHEFDLAGWGGGKLLVAPTLTSLDTDRTDRSVVFDPPLFVLDLPGG
jgi:hypothetical protein